jgi:hypothetical protein
VPAVHTYIALGLRALQPNYRPVYGILKAPTYLFRKIVFDGLETVKINSRCCMALARIGPGLRVAMT